ncbi:MAG: hypothetical protein KA965_02125 [Butyrivibrio sp.]|nr:hypothetical protein [Butyrivibrio sp.]
MIELKIVHTKDFMNKLLNTTCFDAFLLEEAMIQTYNIFSIDGHVQKSFYGPEESDQHPYPLSIWSDMRNVCLSLIRGKHTPVSFKFVLHCKEETVAALLEQDSSVLSPDQIAAYVLSIRFSEGSVSLTTGTAIRTFILDKSYEQIWDRYIRSFLSQNEIAFEEL